MLNGTDLPDFPQDLKERIARLSPETRSLLQHRMKRERQEAHRLDAIPIVDRARPIPLSISQERIWFFDQLMPGSALYHIKRAFRLHGALNLEALQRAYEAIIARHESLRTRIVSSGDGPRQVIEEPRVEDIQVVDLSEDCDEQRSENLELLLRDLARKPFDLALDQMLRITIVRLREDEHILLLVLHHVAGDRWSLEILLRELSQFYDDASAGRSSDLPKLNVQYADYAAWERDQLSGERLNDVIRYWKQRLANAPALELPSANQRSGTERSGGRHLFTIPHDLARDLRAFAKNERVTLYMLMLAAFKVLLHRSTGQTDLVVGSPVANRDRPDLEPLIGMFVGTLVIRTDMAGNPSFRDVVRSVRSGTLEAIKYRDVPFDKLGMSASTTAVHPLLRALFTMQNTTNPVLAFGSIEVEPIPLYSDTAKFDLSLTIYDMPDGLQGGARYSLELFDSEEIASIVEQYMTVLAAAVANPEQPIGSLPLHGDAERVRTLAAWNATKAEFPSCCVHELVEAQVARTPEGLAVVFEREKVSYAELNTRANDLAHRIVAAGIRRGAFVPLMVDRSVDLVVALLGVMKAGAAFVPLDAEWPDERIRRILDDLGGESVLVNGESCRHPALRERVLLHVDRHATEGTHRNGGNVYPVSTDPLPTVDPESPVYAMYTSGSTGRPKAAMIPHRGIVNRLSWMNRFFGREAAAAVLQTTRPVYDSAVWQLFWPLINGGTTVIPSPSREQSAAYLSELIENNEVTLTDFVPSLLSEIGTQLFADPARVTQWRSLRFVILGSEELTPHLARRFQNHFPTVRVVNLYGPTEASIGCIYHEVNGQEEDRIPIGRPISNVCTIILDSYGHPVPLENTGELYLGGACLGLGYLNAEAETERAFIPNPFPHLDSEKLYKTGDLARYNSDGEIIFMGRADHQIKIRGLRVELGEIESALRDDAAVTDAVVTVSDDSAGEKRLVAHVVLARDVVSGAGALDELRGRIRKQLPIFMVPSAFIPLNSMPLLPSGKLNRQALQASDLPSSRPTFEAPRTDLEEKMAEIWSDILGISQIGIRDDFFELGGHSLLVMRVIARVRETFHRDLPVRCLFEAPTIAGLAEAIAKLPDPSASYVRPTITRASREDRLVERSSIVEEAP